MPHLPPLSQQFQIYRATIFHLQSIHQSVQAITTLLQFRPNRSTVLIHPQLRIGVVIIITIRKVEITSIETTTTIAMLTTMFWMRLDRAKMRLSDQELYFSTFPHFEMGRMNTGYCCYGRSLCSSSEDILLSASPVGFCVCRTNKW